MAADGGSDTISVLFWGGQMVCSSAAQWSEWLGRGSAAAMVAVLREREQKPQAGQRRRLALGGSRRARVNRRCHSRAGDIGWGA
jgi:hypothetical protein